MRTLHEAVAAVETFSPAEERFNRRRRTAGLFLAPAVFLILLFAPLGDITVTAHRMAAVMGLVVTLWLTEALRHGVMLDIVAFFVIIATVTLLGPMLF